MFTEPNNIGHIQLMLSIMPDQV